MSQTVLEGDKQVGRPRKFGNDPAGVYPVLMPASLKTALDGLVGRPGFDTRADVVRFACKELVAPCGKQEGAA